MKPVILMFLILSSVIQCWAKDYYLSNKGDDGNSGISASSPFATINRLNKEVLVAGDRVFFRSGDKFYGSIKVSGSGTSASPIIYKAYGSGAAPVITGFSTLSQVNSDWKQISKNVWETVNAVVGELDASPDMVTIDGKVQAMGRYPNMSVPYGSYLKFQEHQGDSIIISNELPEPTVINWTGAQLVVKSTEFTIDTATIIVHSSVGNSKSRILVDGAKIYSKSKTENFINNFGFFIQNDPRTLDSQGEWYYNPGTKKFRIYLTTTPSNHIIKVATQSYGMINYSKDFITIDGLRFEGFNQDCILVDDVPNGDGALHKIFTNCEFQFARTAININDGYSDFTNVENCKALDLTCMGFNSRNADNFSIRDCILDRIAIWPGMGALGSTGYGIYAVAGNTVIARNKISNVGYIPVRVDNSNVRVDSNYIDNFCLTHADGGGIYVGNQDQVYTNRKIRNNVLINAVGNIYGTSQDGSHNPGTHCSGIYLDDFVQNVEVANNTLLNMSYIGLHFHNVKNINVHDNLVLGGGRYCVFWQNNVVGNKNPQTNPYYRMWGITFKNNTIIAKKSNEFLMRIQADGTNSGDFISLMDEAQGAALGTNVNDNFDDNIYARPLNQDSISFVVSWSGSGAVYYKTNDWKTAHGIDKRALLAPKRFTSGAGTDNNFTTYFNVSPVDTVVKLKRNAIDIKGNSHSANEKVTVRPFSGIVYMSN